jgi:hypothetical protein
MDSKGELDSVKFEYNIDRLYALCIPQRPHIQRASGRNNNIIVNKYSWLSYLLDQHSTVLRDKLQGYESSPPPSRSILFLQSLSSNPSHRIEYTGCRQHEGNRERVE